MNLTITTLQFSICSVQSEIKKYELMTQEESATDEELDEYGHYVLDLSRALNELGRAYEQERKAYSGYPTFDQMLTKFKENSEVAASAIDAD
jgi:hypothetical protein